MIEPGELQDKRGYRDDDERNLGAVIFADHDIDRQSD